MHRHLPNAGHAIIDLRKLRDYVLNPEHPEGRHKARVFLSALGVTASDSEWLATAILEKIEDGAAIETGHTVWGTMYRVDIEVWRGNRCAKVRTGWLCQAASTRLTTCFVVGECDETA